MASEAKVPDEIIAYYSQGREAKRLDRDHGKLEWLRTQELIQRFIVPTPARILDVGGGPGTYSFWLTQLGYEVHLVDPTPLHIEQAQATQATTQHMLASIQIGDARQLRQPDNFADAVLLLGPLYHLIESIDRQAALREAYRVLKPGGILFATAISRFAMLLDGLRLNFATEPHYASLIDANLANGIHQNVVGLPGLFTTAYFHHPTDLLEEVRAAAFTDVNLLAIEGIGWLNTHFQSLWEIEENRQRLLSWIRELETEPTLIGASSHLMAVARKLSTA